ncbi:MAG: DUF2284 domain-containing protein [Candidatus Nitrohelix vancouverensis]|uniref:DUF2284 domain-containing protein n=1 Tax=Candidatus Nitrohelix vancouverensis TaxID=2705534 RepID=A0A7T0C3W6_9BACT|nr:MAG: DUF2284 domain-containing protein [Candidatus Nitrohelix vancouverensis]
MDSKDSNVRDFPEDIKANQEFIREALDMGASKSKIIDARSIVLGNWVKLQCQFGCENFGKMHTCPPHSPMADETSEILLDYQKAILLDADDDKNMNEIVLSLETKLRSKGFYKAFALSAQPCDLCETCTVETHCKYPEKARPTLQACGINVQETMDQQGWEPSNSWQPCSPKNNIGMVLIA